ncbi:MAG: glycosyltransferase family 4 protein [Myxococcota bacterium]|nr:glycosyltransferase family 4 protein [Myxococcota bacterium]
MANHYFFRALLRYADFSEYHFFLSNSAHIRTFLEAHQPFIEAHGLENRIMAFDRLDLPEMMKKHNYIAFHQSDHIAMFNALRRLRNSLGVDIPITSFVHSLSYQEHMKSYLEMAAAGGPSMDALIASSQCGKKVLEQCTSRVTENLGTDPPNISLEVVPLGIDEREYNPNRSDIREQLGFGTRDVIALCFGRFSDFDKMDLFPLLQAFGQVAALDKNWRLVLGGALHDKSYFEMVKLWTRAIHIADQVSFVVDPSDEKKRSLFHAADFFVSIADNPQETFGLTVIEAMNAGLPLIVSDFDGYREIVTDEVGVKIPTTWFRFKELDLLQPIMDARTFHRIAAQSVSIDVRGLAGALKRFFSDHSLRRKLGTGARLQFDRKYAHRTIIDQLETIWANLKRAASAAKPQPDPLAMQLFDTFSHYTTRTLSFEDRIQATEFGLGLFASESTYPCLANMDWLIDRRQVAKIIRQTRIPELLKDLFDAFEVPPWRIMYTVLWMLKHDLLRTI